LIPSLSEKYAIDALKYILEKGRIKKTDLLEIITSSWTLDKLIPKLERDGLLEVKKSTMGRRTYEISLTPKGRSVAEQLKRAEEAAKGESVEISDQEARDWAARFREATKGMSLLYHVNVYQDHVSIGYDIAGKNRITNVYVRVNGKGIMRLWCEEDESFECIHVQYAWTLPKVQEMYANNVKNGNVQDNGERR
jgi:DNA-binding MarR family transcriptional regulator